MTASTEVRELSVQEIGLVAGAGGGIDTDAAGKYAAGCLVVAAVAAAIPGGQPIAAAFGIAGAVAGAAAAFAQ